ncbi:MAG: methyltransferase domain-containing protein [Pseudomonadota bacterium]|nr:methyltransferase domain-containing protein [Pseudomonadota bacterium]
MAHGKHSGELGEVYAATTSAEIAEIYNRWSVTYDEYMKQVGYRHPVICAALLARYVPVDISPILDAGSGTGLIGEALHILGYAQIDGLDISAGMLDQARAKGIYGALHLADLNQPLDLAENSYGAIVSCGVFTTGHVGGEGLQNLIALCRQGGHLITTVKLTIWEDEVKSVVGACEAAGMVHLVEQTAPYVSMVGEAGTIPSIAIVLEIL